MSGTSSRIAWATSLLALATGGGLVTASPAGAVSGDTGPSGDYAFAAKLNIGDRAACSGALVDARWVITAATCFSDGGKPVLAGKPTVKTTVTVGRADLTQATGSVQEAVELVPRPDRDVVMVKLAQPVPESAAKPVRLATKAPAEGEQLQVAGFGRTKTEWVPSKLHASTFTVASTDPASVGLNGSENAVICQGDAGAPAVRGSGDSAELVALNIRSWQGGCLGTDENEKRTSALDARLDNLGPWVQQVRSLPQQAQVTAGDFDGDGKADVAALYDYGKSADGRRNQAGLWVFTSDGKTLRAPRTVWESGDGSWNWSASKLTSGDFNGDGKADIAVLYNYGQNAQGRNETGLFVFTSTGDGFQAQKKVWSSTDSWNWNASKLTSGDYNGDGKADIGVLYDYGQVTKDRKQTGLWAFTSTGDGFQEPKIVWNSGNDSWNWDASKVASGDFNGDGKMDVAVLYNYGQDSQGRNSTGLWFNGGANGLGAPKKVWNSDTSWNWNASTLTTGDYNGDGKTDVGVLYDYGKSSDGQRNQTGLWTLAGTATGVAPQKKIWDSTTSWNWSSSQPVSGDFNGDGKTDLAVFYDYGKTTDGRTRHGLWTFTSTGDAMTSPRMDWDSTLQ